MYLNDVLGDSISDDAEFDDLEDFDYVERFITEKDEYDEVYDSEEDYDEFEDLMTEDDEDDEDLFDDEIDDSDEIHEDMLAEEEDIEVHVVCEDCGHKWIDFISEEANESDFDLRCPLCGSSNISRQN